MIRQKLQCIKSFVWPIQQAVCRQLQNNQIQRIEGLESLASLQKLYLEDNEISCVENLQNCTALQELHLSRQRLPGDLELSFHPACVEVNHYPAACMTLQA